MPPAGQAAEAVSGQNVPHRAYACSGRLETAVGDLAQQLPLDTVQEVCVLPCAVGCPHLVMRAWPVGHLTPGDTSAICLQASSSLGPAARWMAAHKAQQQCQEHCTHAAFHCWHVIKLWSSEGRAFMHAAAAARCDLPPSTPPPPRSVSLAAQHHSHTGPMSDVVSMWICDSSSETQPPAAADLHSLWHHQTKL